MRGSRRSWLATPSVTGPPLCRLTMCQLVVPLLLCVCIRNAPGNRISSRARDSLLIRAGLALVLRMRMFVEGGTATANGGDAGLGLTIQVEVVRTTGVTRFPNR